MLLIDGDDLVEVLQAFDGIMLTGLATRAVEVSSYGAV